MRMEDKKDNKRIKAVILDMYGVILKDTGEGFYEYVNKFFPNLTRSEIYSYREQADMGEINYLQVLKRLGFGGDLSTIEKEYLDTVEIDKDFYDFACNIKQHYKLALLSNDSSEWSRFFREKFYLNGYFDDVVVSADVKLKKPDSQIYHMSAERLGYLPEECAYVDDRRKNVAAAMEVGMEGILFNRKDVEFAGKMAKSFKEIQDLLLNL